MARWIAALLAGLLLPACGGGSNDPPATDSNAAGPGTGQSLSVRIVSPDSGTSSPEGSTIPIEAVATDPNGSLVRVDFYEDNRPIGSKSSPPYSITYGRLKAGAHQLCAVGIDINGTPIASSPVTLFVTQGSGDEKGDHGGDKHDRKD